MNMSREIVVATFNLRNGRAFDWCNSWAFRSAAAAATIRELNADLIGLQEAYGFQLRSLRRRAPTYVAVGSGRNANGRGEQTPVLVRSSSVLVEHHETRWFGDTPLAPGSRLPGAHFPRIATTATISIDSLRLRFTSTHLDERSAPRRRSSVDQLVQWLGDDGLPHVVVGDFNAIVDDPIFGVFAAAGLRSALPYDESGTAHHFTGRTDGRRIDHIFIPAGAEVVSAAVVRSRPGGRFPSDHWPVVARVRLPLP